MKTKLRYRVICKALDGSEFVAYRRKDHDKALADAARNPRTFIRIEDTQTKDEISVVHHANGDSDYMW